ncbi:MAG: alpha/beta fold hydrolase [Nitrososphaerales archaeon]|jgi:pimeloyl-ACP methyl ester carboxylesterase
MGGSRAETTRVDGAELFYEVRGAGPALLLVPGGNGEGAAYRALANLLSDRFAVVTYDRRGFSRSKLDGPPDDARRLEIDSHDARLLIEKLSGGPAYVFGSSSGAIVALDLLTRFPSQIRRLVAHEPPLATLLPDAKEQLAILDDVYDTFRVSGAEVAMRKFALAQGIDAGPALPPGASLDPRMKEMMAVRQRNQEFWFEHELRQYPRAALDLAALRAAKDRLVLAGGHDSRKYFPYRPNTVLAAMLHLQVVDFPDGHVGYATHAPEFAEQLASVLLRSSTTPIDPGQT